MEFSRRHLLSIIILYAICMPNKTFGKCPDSLPSINGHGKISCAIIYQNSHKSITQSCTGRSHDISNGDDVAKLRPTKWNDRISAIVVRDGCTFTGYQYKNHKGDIKAFKSTNHHLKDDKWNDRISAYDCHCNYNGWASDDWQRVKTCVNQYSNDIDCIYYVAYGNTLETSITDGGSVSSTVSANAGLSLKAIFSASIEISKTTGYNWETTDIFSETTTRTFRVNVPVGPGDTVSIYQVVGSCDDTTVKTMCFLVWNENKGDVTGQSCQGSNSRKNIHVRTEDNIANITMGNGFFNASMENKFVKSFMMSKFVKGRQDNELSNGNMGTEDVNNSMDDEHSNTSIKDKYINATMDDGYGNTSMDDDYINANLKDGFDNNSMEDEYINDNMEDGYGNITIGKDFVNYSIVNKSVNGSTENGFVNYTKEN